MTLLDRMWQETFEGQTKALWIVPALPPSLNVWERMHWSARNRIKDRWEEYADAYMRTHPLPYRSEWVYVSAIIVFRKNAHRDLSNYDATFWKIFPDVLQRVKAIKDDTADIMRRGPVRFQVDKTLNGLGRDPRQEGLTRIALIAKGPS